MKELLTAIKHLENVWHSDKVTAKTKNEALQTVFKLSKKHEANII